MKVLLISESHIGNHYNAVRKLESEGVSLELLSLQGSRGIKFTNKGYSVSLAIKEYAKKFDLVLLGTDLDLTGTKIASVLHYQLPTKSVRVAFTSDGYVRVGEIFSKERLGRALALSREHMQFANRVRKRFGVGSLGLSKAIAIRRAVLLAERKGGVRVKNGTSTITVLTKAELKGIGGDVAYARLESLYRSGLIDYPRVDNDYINDFPYDLYPHQPLPKFEGDYLFQPFEEKELELNDKTILLELSNRRLITPANSLKILKTIRLFLSSSLKPKKEFEPLVKYLLETISDEKETDYRLKLFFLYRPQLKLSPKLKPSKKLLERWIEEGNGFEKRRQFASENARGENQKQNRKLVFKKSKTR